MKLVYLSLILLASHSTDYTWMGYCCGETDCIQIPVSIIQFNKDSVEVLVNESRLDLPGTSVKESQDQHTYWCGYDNTKGITKANTRCVFYTIGG